MWGRCLHGGPSLSTLAVFFWCHLLAFTSNTLSLSLSPPCTPPATTPSSTFATSATVAMAASNVAVRTQRVVARVATVPESSWRRSASEHSERIRALLSPGLTPPDHPMNTGRRRRRRHRRRNEGGWGSDSDDTPCWTGLDPRHPVYNFLVEYYGLKGAKGPRRLARWSPDPGLLLMSPPSLGGDVAGQTEARSLGFEVEEREIECDAEVATSMGDDVARVAPVSGGRAAAVADAVLLEGATEADLGGTLHLRGATLVRPDIGTGHGGGGGILYSPSLYYGRSHSDGVDDRDRDGQIRAAAPFQWYRSILSTTLNSEPVLHCHGLHEWAMQYHPAGAPPPPSSRYQSHLPLRVSRSTINAAVERRGIHCTHVDALRFFAPAAAPLNHHGASLERMDQLRLEQRGCVHAHMDLLKIALRLQPFVDAALVGDALEVALKARRLDVEASPYDVRTTYGLGVVPVETSEGREEYRRRQRELMIKADAVRERLLHAYDTFLGLAFDEGVLRGSAGRDGAAPERFARAEPGGAPWRRNLIGS